jgi:hypothetical protein
MQQDRDLLRQQLSEAKDQESNSAKHMLHLMQRVNQVFVCVCVACVCVCVCVCVESSEAAPMTVLLKHFVVCMKTKQKKYACKKTASP